jgi:hypothetical protein
MCCSLIAVGIGAVVVTVWCCVSVCGTALHLPVAAVSGSSRAAAVAMRRSLRSGCGAVSSDIGLLVHSRRVAAALGRCACVLVCVDAHDARSCVDSTSRLSNVVVLLFCMCATRGIHSLFAVAVFLLCRALVCAWLASLWVAL